MSGTSFATKVRMQGDPTDPRHGTTNGYTNLDCRCRRCRDAWADYVRGAELRRCDSLAADDPRHGRYTTYENYACRCRPCTDAHTAHSQDYKRRKREAAS